MAAALTKSELIAELAARSPYLRPVDAELVVTAVFDRIARALADGHRVELRGFGAFATAPGTDWPRSAERRAGAGGREAAAVLQSQQRAAQPAQSSRPLICAERPAVARRPR
jgi:hypothetical protein